MPSGLDALLVLIPLRYLINSSVVHRMSVSGRSEAPWTNGKMFEVERESMPELKFCARTSFRREALSILAEIVVPEDLFTVGIWSLECVRLSRILLYPYGTRFLSL